jgi:hypothetical protein
LTGCQARQTGGYWRGFKTASRFDFLEGVDPWMVHPDDVKLTGDDRANASYMVGWSSLGTGVAQSIEFHADPDQTKCLTQGILIYGWSAPSLPTTNAHRIFLPLIQQGVPSRTPQFVRDTSQVAAGRYYLCARVTDGYNTSTAVSDTAVIVSH